MKLPMWCDLMALRTCVIVLASCCGCRPQQPAPPPPPPIEVTVSQPLQQAVTDSLEFTGTTAPVGSVEVRSRVTGFLETVHFKAPAKVKQGDVLFTIDPRPFKNRVDSTTATLEARKALLPKAEFDTQKLQGLFDKGSAAQDELINAISARDALRAEISREQAELEQARLNLEWCQVTAPIPGRISRNLVDPGNVVTADASLLAQIVDDETIYAYFNASEQDVLTVQERKRQERADQGTDLDSKPSLHELKLPVFLGLMTEQGHPHVGVVDYRAPAVDPATGTIQLRGRFENHNEVLLPGLFARMWLPISKPHSALTVAERAFGTDQGRRYLLIVNEKDVVEYRPVEVGTLQNGMRTVRAGIQASDRVIIDGIQRVRPGLTVKSVAAPMPVRPASASEGDGGSQPAKATLEEPQTSSAGKKNGN